MITIGTLAVSGKIAIKMLFEAFLVDWVFFCLFSILFVSDGQLDKTLEKRLCGMPILLILAVISSCSHNT